MKTIKIILLTILISLFSNSYAMASSFDDDSCTLGQSIIARILSTLTTFGLFAAYSENFSMDGAGLTPDATKCSKDYYPSNCSNNTCSGSGAVHTSTGCTSCTKANGAAVQCVGSCNVNNSTGCTNGDTCASTCNAKGGMKICFTYYTGLLNSDGSSASAQDCNWTQAGWSKTYAYPPASIQVVQSGDKLCAQFWTLMGYQTIGCKYLPDCSVFATTSNCYVAQSCSSRAYQNSYALVPMTAMIIQCIKDSLALLFVNTNPCGGTVVASDGSTSVSSGYTTAYFPDFQVAMRQVIKVAITLYFILFGIKMCLGAELPSKGEFFVFGAKYILVLYFSVGITTTTYKNGHSSTTYHDGISTYMLPLFQNGATDLANIVYTAGGVRGLCDYSTKTYASGYEYLSLFDSMDCRVLYYLGLDLSRLANIGYMGIDDGIAMLGAPMIAGLIMPAIFSFQIVFAVFLIIFAVFMLSVIIYFVNLLVLCTIGAALLIYMSPIFVPMALFAPTKSYFDGWLKLLTSFALQPMVVASYMALMLTIFDNAMFGDCSFINQQLEFNVGTASSPITKEIPYFMLCDPWTTTCAYGTDTSLTKCTQTIGYQMNPMQSGSSLTQTFTALFFDLTILNPSVVGNMLSSLITLCLFAFLFYKFAEVLSQFTAELTGGINVGAIAGNPMALVDKAAALVKAYVKSRMGDKKGAAKELQKASGAEGKTRQGGESGASGSVGGDKGSNASWGY